MDKKCLVSEALADGDRLRTEFDKFMPVKAAYWLLPEDDTSWTMYLSSEAFDPSNSVARLIREVPLPYLIYASVRLLPGSDRVVRDVINVRMHFPGISPVRCPVDRLGGVAISEAYLYPLPDSTPKKAEKVTVFSTTQQAEIDRLLAHGVRVSVTRLGEQYYSCRARLLADLQDSQVTYAESIDECLSRIAGLAEQEWPQRFAGAVP
jgi:hypothetical protein